MVTISCLDHSGDAKATLCCGVTSLEGRQLGVTSFQAEVFLLLANSSDSPYLIFVTNATTISKHLKGRLAPRVSDVTFFGPKEVGWGPVLVT